LTRVYACHVCTCIFLTAGVYTPYSPCMSTPLDYTLRDPDSDPNDVTFDLLRGKMVHPGHRGRSHQLLFFYTPVRFRVRSS